MLTMYSVLGYTAVGIIVLEYTRAKLLLSIIGTLYIQDWNINVKVDIILLRFQLY